MPEDGLADEASHLAIDGNDGYGDDFQTAAKRLVQEASRAQQALGYGDGGVRDVTEDFAAAAKLLQPGQLVKDEYFTLFEAVGALEIMDPKMDSGYVPSGDTLEPDFDVCQPLGWSKVLWIMDEMLRLTIVWHDGYPLSQTIFTSLHVDRLLSPDNRPPYYLSYSDVPAHAQTVEEKLVHDVLRPFCIALIKSCALVLHTIQGQNFYEEEDFVTHLFGRELLPSMGAGDDGAMRLLSDAETTVRTNNLGVDDELYKGLMARLHFARHYLSFLIGDPPAWVWGGLNVELLHISTTHHLGTPLPEAFSDKVQRQLATSTPPRPMPSISWDEVLKRWARLFEDLAETTRLTSLEICQSPHSLQRATWAFAYREPPPNTFARAHLQSLLFGSEKITEDLTFFDLLLTDMRDLVLAGDSLADPESFQIEAPGDPRHRCSRVMETFMDKAFDEYMNLYRMVCQNRCRIRRTFTQSVVILDGLEREAMKADAELDGIVPGAWPPTEGGRDQRSAQRLTCWARYYKLMVMSWTIQLGIETDIYLPHELGMMYWYLSQFADRRTKLLEHIQRFLQARLKGLSPSRDARQYAEILSSQDWLASLHKQAHVTRLLASALWHLSSMLLATGVIEPPKQDFAKEQLLYDVRMKSSLGIVCDPIPTLEEYKRSQNHNVSIADTTSSISSLTTQAKALIPELQAMTAHQAKYIGTEEQWKREMKQLHTTCVAVAVQGSQLRRIAEKHGVLEDRPAGGLRGLLEVSLPPLGKRYHDWWVLPLVKEKK